MCNSPASQGPQDSAVGHSPTISLWARSRDCKDEGLSPLAQRVILAQPLGSAPPAPPLPELDPSPALPPVDASSGAAEPAPAAPCQPPAAGRSEERRVGKEC